MSAGLLFLMAITYARPDALVTTEWVAAHLDDSNVRIVDTRTRGYAESHIPGAVWLDIDASRDPSNPPSFLPNLETFVRTLEALGIDNDTRVIFYDDRGGIYGTRPWVLLQLLGHDNAAILNGGWPRWNEESRPTSAETPTVAPTKFEPSLDERWIATSVDVAASIGRSETTLLDTRSAEEVSGVDLRGNPRGGAIPSSIHLDWESTLEADGQTIKPAAALASLFAELGLSEEAEIVTYCQGGGRAAHELFVLHLMGYQDLRLYLGSMEDWSRQAELPLERR